MASDIRSQDERFEQLLGNLLRTGVLLAAAVVAVGGLLYLTQHGTEPHAGNIFRGEPADLRSPSGIVERAIRFNSRGLIMVGLLLLVATPVARVIFSVFGFLRERDYLYVGFTVIVLAVLLYSLFVGETV